MFREIQNFEKFFKFISYSAVFFGFLSLLISGGLGIVSTSLFILVLMYGFFFEGTHWQFPPRFGTFSIFIIAPLYYIGMKYQVFGNIGDEAGIAENLAKMILLLSAIKLLQRKDDRDWLFLYLMSFFEVLLAAGLSINPLYLVSLILYLFVMICVVITFEIRKSYRSNKKQNLANERNDDKGIGLTSIPLGKLSSTTIALLFLIIAFAAPLFFMLPRVGGAGIGSNSSGLTNVTGFSDLVNLGEIGRLLQNDQVVMRARLEEPSRNNKGSLYWRGVALDMFDNKRWSKSKAGNNDPLIKRSGDFYKVNDTSNPNDLTVQTVYLEPIETPILFVLAKSILIQGSFQSLSKDTEGGLIFNRSEFERLSYKVYSDTKLPSAEILRTDNEIYSFENRQYLQLPAKIDGRIASFAKQLSEKSFNRYDKAKAVEQYLQTQFGYSLEMRAQGEEPLADFLFNIREGHCEYFATAMAIMLRTQGIATRIVNGFHEGEYNETADVYVVKQKDAHSWVEVYFPRENVWIPFDPTPFGGQNGVTAQTGISGKFNSYIEALETFWIQYFVSYDNQEQRSLMRSVKNGFADYQAKTSVWLNQVRRYSSDWWQEVRGDKGLRTSVKALVLGIGYLLAAILGIITIVWLYRKIRRFDVWHRIYARLKFRNETTIIEFYERMQKVLASKGFTRAAHQTPLEFAFALNMPEAVHITEKYNCVRFGEKNLSIDESREIENWLNKLENSSAEK